MYHILMKQIQTQSLVQYSKLQYNFSSIWLFLRVLIKSPQVCCQTKNSSTDLQTCKNITWLVTVYYWGKLSKFWELCNFYVLLKWLIKDSIFSLVKVYSNFQLSLLMLCCTSCSLFQSTVFWSVSFLEEWCILISFPVYNMLHLNMP